MKNKYSVTSWERYTVIKKKQNDQIMIDYSRGLSLELIYKLRPTECFQNTLTECHLGGPVG